MSNSLLNKSRAFWNNEVTQKKLIYSDTQIVRFLSNYFSDLEKNKAKKAIEIGCGSGRNLIALDDYHFETHGLDFAKQAIDESQNLAAQTNRNFTLHYHTLENFIDITDEKYDAILWDSPFLTVKSEIEQNLTKSLSLFSPQGIGFLSFRHVDTWFNELGRPIDENCYELDERALDYAGAIYSFFDEKAAASLLNNAGFKILNTERVELWKKNMTQRNVWMHFWVTPHA